MKRTLALVLVIAMLACMLPAFSIASVAADEPETGLNAKIYQLVAKPDVMPFAAGRYDGIVGTSTSRDPWCKYDDVRRFDASIDTLLATSKVVSVSQTTDFAPTHHGDRDGEGNGYFVKWEGTITAKTTATYYPVGRKIDNGFVMFVDQNGNGEFEANEKEYEYWAINHWFDGSNDRLLTEFEGFSLTAETPTAVQLWYYEHDGGEACQINISTNANGDGDVSFADAGLTLDLTQTVYTSNLAVNHDRIKEILPAGVKADGSAAVDDNGCQANMAGNHHYDDTIDALMAQMFLLEEKVLPNYETAAFGGLGYNGFEYEDSLIDYTGYVTATIGGTYQFGTAKVDNCLMVEIQIDGEWVTVYEFWAKNVWNDNSTTYSDTVVTLEEGKSYPIHVTFLEINGGEAIESKIKVNGEEQSMVGSGLVFTTTEPAAPVKPTTVEVIGSGAEWYYMTSGEKNDTYNRDEAWYTDADVYTAWNKTTDPTAAWGTDDQGTKNQTLYLVTTFEIEDASEWAGYELMTRMAFDDNYRVYVNGTLTQVNVGWSNGTETLSLAEEATDLLVDGTNVLAVKLVQGWGGASFSMASLYLTTDENGNNPYGYTYSIGTAQELLDYVAIVNADPGATTGHRISITADIDMTGYDWTPMTRYIGRIYGNGHTISGLTYTATVDSNGDGDGKSIGLFVNDLANQNANGRIMDLNFDNCHLTVEATEGEGRDNSVICGIVAGMVDRGYIQDVTVSNSSIKGNASYAGGIAGVACWSADDKGVHVENCAVSNTYIQATKLAGGILCFARGGDKVTMGNVAIDGVTYDAPEYKNACAGTWGWGENVSIISENVSNVKVKSTLAATEGNYTFYYQTRTNADDETLVDYRIICVANTEWAVAQPGISVSISFTDGETTKTTVQSADTVYKAVTATGDGYTDVYTAADGSVIFGWVITGVPADFAATTPTVAVVD